MSLSFKKCPFCKEEMLKVHIDDHMVIKHHDQLLKARKTGRIFLSICVVAISISIGMLVTFLVQ